MWKQIEIEGKNYFFICRIIKNVAKFILYDLQESWYENITTIELIKRAKELNKRIQFNSLVVEDTLSSAEAVEARLDQLAPSADHGFILYLKYRIETHPFHFKWQLYQQNERELRNEITLPLFELVRGLQQQISELRDVISKKDIELKQYKLDGAILRITTVATKPFDFDHFDNRFFEVNKLGKDFRKLIDIVAEQNKCKHDASKEDILKSKTESSPANGSTAIKDEMLTNSSPRSRKRKSWEIQRKQMVKKLRARERKLEYECSQSQSLPKDLELNMDAIHQRLKDINKSLRPLEN